MCVWMCVRERWKSNWIFWSMNLCNKILKCSWRKLMIGFINYHAVFLAQVLLIDLKMKHHATTITNHWSTHNNKKLFFFQEGRGSPFSLNCIIFFLSFFQQAFCHYYNEVILEVTATDFALLLCSQKVKPKVYDAVFVFIFYGALKCLCWRQH